MNTLPLRLWTRQGCPLSRPLFTITMEVLASAIKQEKNIKDIQIRNKSIFLDNTIKEHSKESTKRS